MIKTITYTANEIAEILPGNHLVPHGDVEISHVLIDSRKAHHVHGSLFVALDGDYRNGHRYVEEMYTKGVRNFLVSENGISLPEANVFTVASTLEALQILATFKRNQVTFPVVGITGSNGKTVVKEWLFQLIHTDYQVLRSPKSFNSQIGVPLSVWGIQPHFDIAIFEAGISKPGEMKYLQKIIQPTIGIFTNIGMAHQENFETLAQKVDEKLNLFLDAEKVIFNMDSEIISQRIESKIPVEKHLKWGKSDSANLQILSVRKMPSETTITGRYQNQHIQLTIPFSDNASIENATHCWLFMLHMGYANERIQERMAQLEPIAMRLEQKEGIDGSVILNDSYNSDIAALEIALDDMMRLNRNLKTVILSDILQSGENPETLYKKVNNHLKNHQIYRFIGIGEELVKHQELFQFHSMYFFKSTQEFLDAFHSFDFSNHGILVKGARKFRFERIISRLALKSHQTELKIHLDALRHNLNFYRKKLQPNVKTMVMVKAYGYGAGGPDVARVLASNGVDYLGVAYVDEGVSIRKSGISIPIMVMNPAKEAFSTLINYDLEPEIYSLEMFQEFAKTLETEGVLGSDYKIHIKIDTGMNRLGFKPDDVEPFLKVLLKYPYFKVASVFSHLVGSDDSEFDVFTENQINLFNSISEKIENKIGYRFIKHILNTGGIERFPEAQFDMVRLGIGIYGIAADRDNQQHLENVTSLHSIVIQVKNVQRGESIGYNRSFIAYTDMKIAIIPVGYADGLDRRLSNGIGKVYVSGEKRPIVGNVCMDLIMVDVTGLNTVVNERVEIFGPHISVPEIARLTKSISHEVLAGIPPRVKRVYIKEDS